jgi:hypothetical protein
VIALAWWLGSIFAYFAVGYVVALWDRPYLYDRIRDIDPSYTPKQVREEVRWISTVTMIFWPLRLPYLVMANAVDKRDPDLRERLVAEREQEIAEREQEIAELERKLFKGQ